MKVRVIRDTRYWSDDSILHILKTGEVVEVQDNFARCFLDRGIVCTVPERETKPLKAQIEIKGHSTTRSRTRKSSRAKV